MPDSNLPRHNKNRPPQQERKNFLQQIADFTPELLFVIDLEGPEIIYINRKAKEFLGLTENQIYEQGREIFRKVLHPDDYQRRLKNLEACKQLPDHMESVVEVRWKTASGNWNWFRIKDKVFKRDSGGAVSQIIGTAQNIHEQKLAEEKLQEEHRRLKDAQAIGHIGSFERALPGDLIICSEEFLHINGLERHSPVISTHQFISCVHPDDQEAFREAVHHTHKTGEPLNMVNRILRPDGSIRYVHRRSEILKNAQGIPVRVYGTIQDVTELKESEHTIRQMLNGSIAAIGMLESVRNEQGKIIDFIYRGGNQNAETILNQPAKKMPEKPSGALWPGIKNALFEEFVHVTETGAPLRVEKYFPSADTGNWFDISAVKNGDGFILTLHDKTAEKKAGLEVIKAKDELAKRATDKYLALFNSINEGFCIIELIFNQSQKPVDFRYIDTNPVFEKQTGLREVNGKTVRELVPGIEASLIDIYGRVAISGEAARFENHLQSMGRWFDVKAYRIGRPADRQVAVIFNDITQQKRNELNLAFLAEIKDDFTRLRATEEIMETVGEKMYQHFGVSRLTMAEVDEAADAVNVIYEKGEPRLRRTSPQRQRLSDFVGEEYKREFKVRPVIAIDNLSTDPRTAAQAEAYKALGAGSQLHAHYLRNDLWCFIITLQKEEPYHWQADEINLLQEIANRLYLRLEKARAEEALRESEAKYRDLFNSIDQGFALAEVILDKNHAPADYRILEVNPRFQDLTGISRQEALSGKTIRQIRPDIEEKWIQYGGAALSGEPQYIEEFSGELENRWFEINIYRTDGPEKGRLAILCNDITDRKNAREQIKRQNAVLEGINRIFREALTSQTEEELGQVCLNVAEEITGSRIGFMGETDPETGKIGDIAISDRSWKEFGVKDSSSPKKKLPVGLNIHGIYGRVILGQKGFFTNHPPSHPDSIGTPKSHPQLDCFLGVPLMQAGRAKGLIGLANRPGGYGPAELEMAEALAPAIVQAFLRKRTEEALRKSEEQFRAVVDLVPDLLWSKDPQGNTDWYNRQWKEYTGQTVGESTEYTWLNGTHPEDGERSLLAFRAAKAAGTIFRTEHRIRRHDGVYRWFLVQKRPVKDNAGNILRWYGSATDVHEERMAMETLRQSEEQFRFMANIIPQIVWITDAEGNIEFLNQLFFTFTGISNIPQNAMEMASMIIHPDDFHHTREAFENAMEQNISFTTEHRIKSAKGEYRWFLVRAEPYHDPVTGKLLRLFGTSTDIHAHKLAEKALTEAKEEAEKAAKAKEEFLSVMSHEIRTPLNAVVGFTHLLLQQDPREDQEESLKGLRYSSANLMNLINDILDFSKIEAGKAAADENEFDLLDLMYSLKQAHQAAALENGNQLKINMDDEIPEFIITDQLKLSQILHNLLGNAIKFTRQGNVSLEVKLKKKEGDNLWLDFAVTDTGIGIAENKIDRIFEKFSQADSSTIRNYGGTGLGLTISKLLLELLGSQIKVESQEGAGSRFYFTLPLKAGTEKKTVGVFPAEPEEEKNLRQMSILVVEDVDLNRLLISKFLKQWWNLIPDEAVNGKEAVEKTRLKNYDLILMDVRMPEMNGYEATSLIREMAGRETTPVIALTADTGSDIKQNPEAALFSGVITKPFNPADLRRTILLYMPKGDHKKSTDVGSADAGKQQVFQEVEKQMNEDPEEMEFFYKLAVKHLQEYKEVFREALTERDLKKLGDMKHKAAVLLDTFRFKDLKAILKKAQSLLKKKADAAMLKQMQKEGDALFDQKIRNLKEHMDQRNY